MIADRDLAGELVVDRYDMVDRSARSAALSLAVEFLGPHGDLDRVMVAAARFLAFLEGKGVRDAGADPAAEPG